MPTDLTPEQIDAFVTAHPEWDRVGESITRVFVFSDFNEAMGFVVLLWAVALSWLYGTTPHMVRLYEKTLKYIVWGVVVCFAIAS